MEIILSSMPENLEIDVDIVDTVRRAAYKVGEL